MHSTFRNDITTVETISSTAAENNPNRVAFSNSTASRKLTWSEYDTLSKRAANAFQEYTAQGDRVAFVCENSIDHVTLWNGALKAGCIVTNLHTRSSPETMRYCIDAVRPEVLVVDEEFSQFVEERVSPKLSTNIDVIVTTGTPNADYEISMDEFLSNQPDTELDIRVTEDDIAAILWTSGTTGRPTGWCHTHRGLVLKGMKMAGSRGADRTDKSIGTLSPSFGAWYSTTLPSMIVNSTTYFLRDWDPERFVQLIDEMGVTNAGLVTTMWREILRLDSLDEYDFSSLESIGSTGERLDSTTFERLQEEICENIGNGYAATEVIGTSISGKEMEGDRIESVGKPMIGTRLRVIEEGGSPDDIKPPGEVGEIIINGSDCAVWAWRNTEKTEEAFEDGWWYSGDLGYKDEDGYLFLEGRADFMIKSKGAKVFPGPIEECLNDHPDVVESAVIGVDDEEYGQKVVAVVNVSGSDVNVEELDEWCLKSDEIARFERPREYYFVDRELPRTPSGKLDRTSADRFVE